MNTITAVLLAQRENTLQEYTLKILALAKEVEDGEKALAASTSPQDIKDGMAWVNETRKQRLAIFRAQREALRTGWL